ncbi:D-alanine-D-alanine ligase [Microbacteriaceae bacterium SG_E_30_P1]|uniref:D-alanine--D-alanine ligase n=1 Tax=Antiquaquibacter oligotrophicus TaxID=2880260 RepID=A0ABT6KT52_9MICO|nr:D-alanine--D-alanine ligase [Antiquaquibacter oligotrophicus]MDH6182372.1 D-alanine-D-alanine ligase [Antiquaquibacter oligotrophicus]UDF14654.1 D-alanine--D-alanine ligase [Antiquaquibacter oligotrophicus]
MSPRILVLAGGISHERDVSLRSGRRVADSLAEHGLSVELRDPDATLLHYLRETRPDVVWPALHGASGEDGALRGLLDFIGIPYVGSRADAARLAWDKPTAKTLVARAGVRTPASIALSRDAFRELGAHSILEEISDEFSGPLVVKPAQGGSAQGVTMVEDRSLLPRAMVDAYTYCDVALIEQKISGTEIAVGVIDNGAGPVALPAVEIEPLSGVYSFEARYNAGETRFYVPARISEDVAARAIEAALAAHGALGLRHISRVDLIIDGAGTPWFLEANVLPGLTETSILPQALEAAGHDLGWVYHALAEAAIAESKG